MPIVKYNRPATGSRIEGYDKPTVAAAPLTKSTTATPTQAYEWSPQQLAVYEWVESGTGSLFVEAVAGSGKTTTMVEATRRMTGDVALAAFNKKIADEISARTRDRQNVTAGTFHSFGFRAWRRVAARNLKIDARLKEKEGLNHANVAIPLRDAVSKMVSLAKQSVVGKLWKLDDVQRWQDIITYYDVASMVRENPTPFGMSREQGNDHLTGLLIKHAQEIVKWSESVSDTLIDFDDMIWLPLLCDAPIYQNDWVLVDEAQDTNPARRLLAERMLKIGGRAIFVGDRHQAIYGFTGADNDAVDQIIRHFNCSTLPLSVTYRCSKAATKMAQEYVPQIEAHENNKEGRVVEAGTKVFTEGWRIEKPSVDPGWAYDGPVLEEHLTQAELVEQPKKGDAILCRVTAPLIELAFSMIRRGVACHVEGRDIGRSIAALASRWKGVITIEELVEKLEGYRRVEILKLETNEHLKGKGSVEALIERVNDRVDTLLVLTEGLDTVQQVLDRIRDMFDDTEEGEAKNRITLSTVHKAKGREWDRVFILGFYEYMPSKWAKRDWQIEQETNLIYVACTRTKGDLVLTPPITKRGRR
jgi:superfamily I DNA/RNA helicase